MGCYCVFNDVCVRKPLEIVFETKRVVMHIVILQGPFFPVPPILGGAVEKMWFKLGQEFARLGHQVTHVSRKYSDLPDKEIIKNVSYVRVPGFNAPRSMLMHKLLDALYSWRAVKAIPKTADIVVTHSFWLPIFLRRRKKFFVYVDVQRMPKGQMRFYSNAERLRANSSAVVKAIKEELPSSQHDKIGMVPNSLPFEVPRHVDLDLKQRVILYCGRVHPEKGLELLAASLRELNIRDWEIQIIGPWDTTLGGGGETFKKHLDECFVFSDVKFLGPIFDEEKLNSFYSKAAIFVYPSLAEKGETFGLAPLEAMAWGAVPIVSDLDCFKDFITDEKNGLIFNHNGGFAKNNLAEKIRELACNDKKRKELSLEAMKVARTHSTARIAAEFTMDFENLLERKNEFNK